VWAVLQGRAVTFWPPKLGARLPTGTPALRSFCERIIGHWWSIRPWDPPSLGFVSIEPYEPTRTVKVIGDIYNLRGDVVAHWESRSSCVDPTERKVYYYWTGTHTSETGSIEDYKGFCEMTFSDSSERPGGGDSVFSDTNLSDVSRTEFKKTRLMRCTEDDAKIISRGDRSRIAGLVQTIQQENK
jgi:hypothetical protein